MSDAGKPVSELGFDKLSDRLQKSLACGNDAADNANKPDFRELDLGSPVSPLRTRGGGPGTGTGTGPTASGLSAATTSSSSSSSGSVSGRNSHGSNNHHSPLPNRMSDAGKSHSGELSVESSPTFAGIAAGSRAAFKPGHTRSKSGGSAILPPSYSSSATSPAAANVLPTGNICPSGKILKTGMATRSTKTDVLGSGTGHYGHGSIMRSGATAPVKSTGGDSPVSHSRGYTDPEELKRLGNEQYKRGHFTEALTLYDRAISMSPENASYHCNRAAALMGLKNFAEAVKECDEAIKLDNGYVRAHHRLGSLLLSLGQVENARRHICFPGYHPDPIELKKLEAVEKHLSKCTDARRVNDWTTVLIECESAIASGADASPQLFSCRAEALLKLRQLDDADTSLSKVPKHQASNLSCAQAKFFGMHSEAYLFFVRAQIDMALGRFENAVISIEKAGQIDSRNVEVSVMLRNVRSVARARARGNDLYKSERFTEACSAYGDGLRLDPSSSVLYCNRAACWFKLGLWERSLDDCNHALHIHPTYTKALLRRAASNSKLEKWAESVKDYETLRRVLPHDNDVAESLFHAQVALKKSRGEEVYNMKFGGEVELIRDLEQFKSAVASTGASVVHFEVASDLQCKQLSPFLDTLCTRYPSINFLKETYRPPRVADPEFIQSVYKYTTKKLVSSETRNQDHIMVDIEKSPEIANAENVKVVPTFKIYKTGQRVKEMICPSPEVLESSIRHYSF